MGLPSLEISISFQMEDSLKLKGFLKIFGFVKEKNMYTYTSNLIFWKVLILMITV